MEIRPALASEVADLDRIALEAKGFWGYSAKQLRAWADELATRPETIEVWPTVVAELEGRVAGFAQVDPTRDPWELVSLWVAPDHMRLGIGRALLAEAVRAAAGAKQHSLTIDSDPNAAGFYESMGARRKGRISAPIPGDPDRYRPQYLLATDNPELIG